MFTRRKKLTSGFLRKQYRAVFTGEPTQVAHAFAQRLRLLRAFNRLFEGLHAQHLLGDFLLDRLLRFVFGGAVNFAGAFLERGFGAALVRLPRRAPEERGQDEQNKVERDEGGVAQGNAERGDVEVAAESAVKPLPEGGAHDDGQHARKGFAEEGLLAEALEEVLLDEGFAQRLEEEEKAVEEAALEGGAYRTSSR